MSDRLPIEIAVLDMAGTTVVDNDLVQTAVMEVCGNRFDAEVFSEARGRSKRDMFAALLGPESVEQAHAQFEDRLLAGVRAGRIAPFPDSTACLGTLRAQGLRTCLITGFSRPVRKAILDHLGWAELVDLTLSPEDAGRGRPAPDLILAALLKLQATDVRAVAVAGDTTNDLLAAHHAGSGIRAGIATGAHNAETLRSVPHTHLLSQVGELVGAIEGWAN